MATSLASAARRYQRPPARVGRTTIASTTEAAIREDRRHDMQYRVRVERNKLRFAAAHFATFGGECEPLHGHNYAVSIEVEGSLTDDAWV